MHIVYISITSILHRANENLVRAYHIFIILRYNIITIKNTVKNYSHGKHILQINCINKYFQRIFIHKNSVHQKNGRTFYS